MKIIFHNYEILSILSFTFFYFLVFFSSFLFNFEQCNLLNRFLGKYTRNISVSEEKRKIQMLQVIMF